MVFQSDLAAARALVAHTDLSAADVVRNSLQLAGEICVYTNEHITIEVLKRRRSARRRVAGAKLLILHCVDKICIVTREGVADDI